MTMSSQSRWILFSGGFLVGAPLILLACKRLAAKVAQSLIERVADD